MENTRISGTELVTSRHASEHRRFGKSQRTGYFRQRRPSSEGSCELAAAAMWLQIRQDPVAVTPMLHAMISSIQGFDTCWSGALPPPREQFDATLAAKLGRHVREAPCAWELRLKPESKASNSARARLDGVMTIGPSQWEVYADIVWIPGNGILRCKVAVTPVTEAPAKVSASRFAELIREIDEDKDLVLESQIYEACIRADVDAPEFKSTFAEIFGLFERFPDEDFGAPCPLVPLLEQHGEFEAELQRSLKRRPSMNGLMLVNRILSRTDPSDHEQMSHWIGVIRNCARHPRITEEPLMFADEIIRRFGNE